MTSPTQTTARPGPLRPGPARPLVQAFLDAFARGDVDAALALVAPQAVVTVHPLGIGGAGRDALRAVLGDLVRAFPDLLVTPAGSSPPAAWSPR